MSVLVITAPVFRRLVLQPAAQRVAVTTLGVRALVLRPPGQTAVRVVGSVTGLNIAPRVSQLVVQPRPVSKLVLISVRSRINVALGSLGERGPAGADGADGVCDLTEPTLLVRAWDGVDGVGTYTWNDLLPVAPAGPVLLFHSSVGILYAVEGDPVPGQFQQSGDTLQTIRFGYAPNPGDTLYALPYRRVL